MEVDQNQEVPERNDQFVGPIPLQIDRFPFF